MSENTKMNYPRLFKNRSFSLMLTAQTISRLGDAVDMIAYGYMVYQLTGSALLLATLFAVNGIPSVFFSLFSGVLVGYIKKKPVVWLCDIGRGVVVTATALLYLTGHLEVWHLYVFTLLNSSFESFRQPAASSMFVNELSPQEIELATSLRSSVLTLSELLGYGLAGVLIGLTGTGGAIFFDAVTFYLCGLLILAVHSKEQLTHNRILTLTSGLTDFKEGLVYVLKNPFIRTITLLSGCFAFFLVPFNALQAAYVKDVLHRDATALSYLSIAFMVAMIIGSILVPWVKERITARLLFVLGGLGLALSYGAYGLLALLHGNALVDPAYLMISFFMGFCLPFVNVPISIALNKQVDRAYLPRVFSLVSVLALAANPLGGFIVGLLLTKLQITDLFYISAIAIGIIFLLQLGNKSFKQLDATDTKD